eukprot:10119353-Prorocentrum_lima.AAC.1
MGRTDSPLTRGVRRVRLKMAYASAQASPLATSRQVSRKAWRAVGLTRRARTCSYLMPPALAAAARGAASSARRNASNPR